MQLSEPRIRTRASHHVDVRIEDGPVLTGPGLRAHGQPIRRFRATRLSIAYVDGLLTSVEVSGPRINKDGSEDASGASGSIDYELPAGGALREDTPDWVREVVEAHPWPGVVEYRAALECNSDPCTYCRVPRRRFLVERTGGQPFPTIESATEHGRAQAQLVYGYEHRVLVEARSVGEWADA